MSQTVNTIRGLEQAIDAGRYGEALTTVLAQYPALGDFSAQLDLPNKRHEQYVVLKLFNRLQWLREALALAQALQQQPNLKKNELIELAIINILVGQPQGARQWFSQAIKRFGADPLPLSEVAFTYEQQGDPGKSEALLAKLVPHYLGKGELNETGLRIFFRLVNLRVLGPTEQTFIEGCFKKNKYSDQRAQLAHILAIAARQRNDLEREIDYLLLANEQARQDDMAAGSSWTQSQSDEKLRLIKQLFPKPKPEWLEAIAHSSHEMIFILGMPRSGTTLIEQIIGAHSRVGNCGESLALEVMLTKALRTLGGLVELGDFSLLRNLRHFSQDTLESIQQGYLAYQQVLSDAVVITDKQLAMIDFVGLMQALFPKAKFVYIERNSLDNCVSLMQRNFKGAPYSNDPVQIIGEQRAYAQRIQHWVELYPEKIYRVSYEALVSDPENQFRALIERCALDWQPQIMSFHQRDNSVRTPSLGQVRQGINTAAVEKWHKYERLIEPALREFKNFSPSTKRP